MGHFLAQSRVQSRVQGIFQLAACLGGHAFHHGLHLSQLLPQPLQQLVKALGWIGTKHGAELLHEPIEIRLPPGHFIPHHLVELAHHLRHSRHIFGRHALNLLLHLLGDILRHLALQQVQQLLEHLLRLRVDKVVLHQSLNLAAQALRKGVQLLPVALGALLQHLVKTFLLRPLFF